MTLLACSISLLAVTVIYLFWRSYRESLTLRRRVLRERVAHMLWIMAESEESPSRIMRRVLDNPVDVI